MSVNSPELLFRLFRVRVKVRVRIRVTVRVMVTVRVRIGVTVRVNSVTETNITTKNNSGELTDKYRISRPVCRRHVVVVRRRDDDVRRSRTYIAGFSVTLLCKYLSVFLTRCCYTVNEIIYDFSPIYLLT